MALHKIFRFIYLNTYAFLLMICGCAAAVLPLRKVSAWLLIPQIIVSLVFFQYAARLFSTWKDKKVKYRILYAKNKDEFKPETFKIFMQAPCGRLLTKAVLRDVGLQRRYRELLVYKEPFFVSLKTECTPTRTRIYLHETEA